ncbi:hypothetical protein [Amycolatopsis tolypomycina]|uniref:hypothetical protein n=1 Tax=Amycolatopsis tolypomycina TaxID=208445 RepID=UPI0033B60DB2
MPTEQRTTPFDDSLRVIALEVADDLAELARVRAWADQLLQDLPEDQRVDALMVVDELAANASGTAHPRVRCACCANATGSRWKSTTPASTPPARDRLRPTAGTGSNWSVP